MFSDCHLIFIQQTIALILFIRLTSIVNDRRHTTKKLATMDRFDVHEIRRSDMDDKRCRLLQAMAFQVVVYCILYVGNSA